MVNMVAQYYGKIRKWKKKIKMALKAGHSKAILRLFESMLKMIKIDEGLYNYILFFFEAVLHNEISI